jgi:hypothetical protein
VPKDASGMTGAAILPSGTNAQRASIATPVVGMQRFNTDTGNEEIYTGATLGWRNLAWNTLPPTSGDLTISANGPLSGGTYTNVTINAGITATVSGLVEIVALGNITINGSINGVGGGAQGGWINIGSSVTTFGQPGQGISAGSPAGFNPPLGAPGGSAISVSYLLASGGASGFITGGANEGYSIGGKGGASLIIRCLGTLTVSGASTIDMSGSLGTSGSTGMFVSGGGGGSGGLIYLEANTLSVAGILNSKGGNGVNAISGYNGGGGGGGGYIVLTSPSTITDTSTKSVTGGAAGSGISSSGFGGGGGGFGGAGGTSQTAGSAGQILTNYYL